jgi:hypothetical protein
MLGSAAYLQGVQWCIQQRCKILGLDAPKTVNVNWRQAASDAGANPDEIMNKLVEAYVKGATDAEFTMQGENDNG